MHPCLKIPEILTNIFSYICIPDSPAICSNTLAHLAITCRDFREPALDLLWRSQSSLSSLMHCLPSDAILKGDVGVWGCSMSLTRDLQPSDYTRVYYYSSRIAYLGLSGFECSTNPLTHGILLSRKPSSMGPLFPSLRNLDISLHEFCGHAPCPQLVIGQRLKNITIRFDADDFWNLDAIPWDNVAFIMKPVSSGILGFKFTAYTEHGTSPLNFGSPHELMQLFSSFQTLQSLSIPSIELTYDCLAHLATLPRLKTMNISISSREASLYASAFSSDVDVFPGLKSLSLSTDSLSACSELLKHSGFQCLESLTVQRQSLDGCWDLDSFFYALQARLSHTTFAELVLIEDSDFYRERPQASMSKITFNTLIPLLTFPHFTVLKIGINTPVELNDDAILRIAEAWPCLRVFRLFEETTGALPVATLSGLLTLAAYCPHLEQVTLRVNALDIPHLAQVGEVIPAPNLYRLNVCTSPLKRSSWVASFLSVVFPALSDLSFGWRYPALDVLNFLPGLTSLELRYWKSWEGVEQLLRPVMASHDEPDHSDYT